LQYPNYWNLQIDFTLGGLPVLLPVKVRKTRSGGAMLNKKFLYIGGGVIGVLVIILLILGFSGGKKKEANNNQAATNSLIVWDSFDDEYTFKKIFEEFEKNNKISVEFVKKDPSKYETESIDALAAGNGPDIPKFTKKPMFPPLFLIMSSIIKSMVFPCLWTVYPCFTIKL
jgi:hypothetical protein